METREQGRQIDGSSDRRWVVIREDGGFSSLGRATDPTDEEVAAAERVLTSSGVGGWLAVAEHSFYRESFPECVEVRKLGSPQGTFEDAIATLKASLTR